VKAELVAAVTVAGLVTAGRPKAMVKVTTFVTVAVALVALTVTGKEPFAPGVPLMRPVDVLTVTPAGSPVALNAVGEFVAVIW